MEALIKKKKRKVNQTFKGNFFPNHMSKFGQFLNTSCNSEIPVSSKLHHLIIFKPLFVHTGKIFLLWYDYFFNGTQRTM